MVPRAIVRLSLTMIFEFLIACRLAPDTNIQKILTDLFAEVLENNSYVFEEDAIADMIQFRHERSGGKITDDGVTTHHKLIGFALELPDEIESIREVVDEFATSLPDTPTIFHVVKFEDPLLQDELAIYAKEIYALEMKLRRVLSLIYLHAYQGEDPFDLLRDEQEQPFAREKPTLDQMKAANENQFFHLTFSQYINLNRRPPPKLTNITDILEVIRKTEQYNVFRAKILATILRNPVEKKDDTDLIASLKELMAPIEQMRNCVAHNRRPTKSINENYPDARSQLEERLGEYLKKWETQQ